MERTGKESQTQTDVDTSSDSNDDIEQPKSPLESTMNTPSLKTSGSTKDSPWRKMPVGTTPEHNKFGRWTSVQASFQRQYDILQRHWFILLVSVLIFAVLCGAGIAVCVVFTETNEREVQDGALGLAVETGAWFSDQLDQAILPLFSLAHFATELEIFHDLPDQIGPAGEAGSLPFLPPRTPGGPITHRNVTGVCDEPALVERFTQIASTIKRDARMQGVLVNLQLAPEGVVCLLHPLNNTEDFEDGVFMDNSGAQGLDLFTDPAMKAIAEASIKSDKLGIAGPLTLRQCVDCHAMVEKAFIARLPIQVGDHKIVVDGVPYNRWGFATALINWKELVHRSGVYENFASRGLDFRLTRTDRKYNQTTDSYYEEMVVLAETPNFHMVSERSKQVSTSLDTTNNEWEITVVYEYSPRTKGWVITVVVLVSFCVAWLVYMVLIQKQMHADMLGKSFAQEAKVEVERDMTAYFAHELRNPLGAIDSALSSFPDDLPDADKDLIEGMQLCSSFMSSIMNNLLDVRKMDEGKMSLRSQPMSLSELVNSVHKMLTPSVKSGVKFNAVCNTKEQDWVMGDNHRMQQVFTNVVTNAIKYTSSGSITMVLGWEEQYIKFECIDTGPGIPIEQQEKMFERYVQRGGAPGTGLGLAIAKHIVDLMDGSIRFVSDPTVKPGTTCMVMLPLEVCEKPEQQLVPPQDIQPIMEQLSLLITDDISMNRLMLKRRFKKGIIPNCVITEATTGEEALKLCEKESFDVIMVDQYMEEAGGVMVGTDVVMAMRKRMKLDSIIIGSSGNDLESQFLEAGADFVWQKPIPRNAEIIQQLRGALERRNSLKLSASEHA